MEILHPKTIRILVADDEVPILDMFQEIFDSEKVEQPLSTELNRLADKLFGGKKRTALPLSFGLAFCRQGDAAVDLVKNAYSSGNPFAIAFVDVRMPPGPDGVWVAEQIRTFDPDIEIVIVTAFSDVNPRDVASRVPPMHKLMYIQKPFHLHEILQFSYALGSKWLMERELHSSQLELEKRIRERTRELEIVNEKLFRDEEKYRNMVQNISDYVCVHDENGKIIESNLHFQQNLGYLPEEANHLNFRDLIPEYNWAGFDQYLERISKNGHDEGRMQLSTKDGQVRTIEYRNHLVRGKNGRNEIHACGRDITDRIQADNALKESETRYRTLFEKAGDAILILDTHPDTRGNIISANQAAADMHGYTIEELVKLNIHDLNAPNDMTQVEGRIKRILRGEWVYDEVLHRKKDGTVFPLAISAGPLDLIDHQYILTFERDITETKRLEKQLYHAQKLDAIGTLAGGIAHDFNNILSAIMGYTEISIAEAPRESRIPQKLCRVMQACQRAKDLVNQILTFSRQTEQERRPVHIKIIVKEALKLLRASIPSTIAFREDIRKDTGIIQADATQIHQIMMNLCTNAAHAMQDRSGILEVHLSNIELKEPTAVPDLKPGPYVRLVIRDNGMGMDSETMGKIFDPFFTTKKHGQGTGLGLSMVHGIVKSMEGAIVVKSALGTGTTFEIYFPRIDADADHDMEPAFIFPIGNEKILLVDDEEFVLEMTEEILESLGYEVTARINSIEALHAFCSKPDEFDLVITDQTMPHMTGVQLAAELVKVRPDIPIILCTGFSKQFSAEEIESMGVSSVAMKPLLKKDLSANIRNVLDRKSAR